LIFLQCSERMSVPITIQEMHIWKLRIGKCRHCCCYHCSCCRYHYPGLITVCQLSLPTITQRGVPAKDHINTK
jgi:hypothetical protein